MDLFALILRRTRALLDGLSAAGVLGPGIDLDRSTAAPPPAGSACDLVLDAALVHARDLAAGTDPARLGEALAAGLSVLPEVEAADRTGPGFIAVTLRAGARSKAVASILRDGAKRVGAAAPGAGRSLAEGPLTLADARASVLAEITAALAVATSGSPADVRPRRRASLPCGTVAVARRGVPLGSGGSARDCPTTAEVVATVGADAFRIAVASRRPEAALHLDLDALGERSSANPAFWLPYAHARFRAVLRRAALAGPEIDLSPSALAEADLALLADPGEVVLVRLLVRHAHAASQAAAAGLPHRYGSYLADLAEAVHRQWNRSKDQPQLRFVNEEQRDLTKARLALVTASTIVLKSGLGILGVTAPDEMP